VPTTNDGTPRERELQRANYFHAVLLAMAGHDLRQPLQVIMNAYDWLSRRLETSSEKEYLRRGDFAIAQLTKQLDLLVDALRLHQQAAKVMPVPVPLVPMLIRLDRDHEELASRKGLTLRIRPTGVAVMSDPVLLEVTLRNLVRNALKYTGPGGQVLVGCRRRGSRVRIEIHDTGSGSPQTRLQECSMPFIGWIRARPTAWAWPVRRPAGDRPPGPQPRGSLNRRPRVMLLDPGRSFDCGRASKRCDGNFRPTAESGTRYLRRTPVEPPVSHWRHPPFAAGDKIVTSSSC
jgi:hypothetical protein